MADTEDDSGARNVDAGARLGTHLVIALECDRPLSRSARYDLDGIEQVTIGRGEARSATRRAHPIPTLDVRIPGRSLSTRHARLIRVGYSWAVEDLESKNGVFVDGERVTRAVLGPESVFEVGHTFLSVRPIAIPFDAPKDFDASSASLDNATLNPLFALELEKVSRLVSADVPVLLTGESGTGKEVLARYLHARTQRSGSFVAVNCGAIPAALVESQLFGHVKGAFSDATRDTLGFVREAEGGTLFLDEIADLPKASQAALLRTLQEREVVPVGATRPVPIDICVLAATHEALDLLVERGAFRRDLFARIAGCSVELPPLRERLEDLGILVAALLPKVAPKNAKAIRFSSEVGRLLLSYEWPLNIRELEHCLTTCAALAPDGYVDVQHLPANVVQAHRAATSSLQRPSSPVLNERDTRLRLELLAQLSHCAGNVTDVARAMGTARTQVHRWCKRFSVDPNAFRH